MSSRGTGGADRACGAGAGRPVAARTRIRKRALWPDHPESASRRTRRAPGQRRGSAARVGTDGAPPCGRSMRPVAPRRALQFAAKRSPGWERLNRESKRPLDPGLAAAISRERLPGPRAPSGRRQRRRGHLHSTINEIQQELGVLVSQVAPQLLAERGLGVILAAKLIAGIDRFASDAQLARMAGCAPIPVSSGRTDRHRLDPGGNRQLNHAIHLLAISKIAHDPRTAV